MKKLLMIFLCAALCLSLVSCSRWSMNKKSAETTANSDTREGFEGVTAPPVEDITDAVTTDSGESGKKAAAIEAVKALVGEEDPETGLKFIFSYDGTEESDGVEYVKIRVSEKDEDGVLTLYGYYLADEEGNVVEG